MFPMKMKGSLVSSHVSRRFSLRRFLPTLGLGLLAAAMPAQAQVHKCVVGGRVSYQSLPCGAGTEAGLKLARDEGAGRVDASDRMPWTELEAGMSEAEVRKRVPGVTSPLQPDTLANGAQMLLVKEVQVAGMPFRAQYYFLDGGYYQVSMMTDPLMRGNDEIRAMYGQLRPLLLKALGQASGEAPLGGQNGELQGRTEWTDAAGNDMAWLSVLPGPRGRALLTFGHRPEGVPPSGKTRRQGG